MRFENHKYQDHPKSKKISEDLIEKYSYKINWKKIVERQVLSEYFMVKHSDKLTWEGISRYQDLTEEFIGRHKDTVSWSDITLCQELSEEFILNHLDYIDWKNVAKFQKLSEEFLDKYGDKLDWSVACCQENCPDRLIDRYCDKFEELHWINIIVDKPKLSDYIIEKYLLPNLEDRYILWIFKRNRLSESFIMNNINKWSDKCLRHIIDNELVTKNSDNYKTIQLMIL